MNEKTTARVTEAVTQILAPGERIEMVEAAQIGKVSAKKQVAASAAVGIATGGAVVVALRPQAFYLVLTDRRLIFVNNIRGRVGKVAGSVPRESINAESLRSHVLTLSMNVTIDGTPQRLSWGRAQGGMARTVAAALTSLTSSPAV